MPLDPRCERVRAELSAAHDEHRPPNEEATRHIDGCGACALFAAQLSHLDELLAADLFEKHPDVADAVVERLAPRRTRWMSIAAVALVGLTVGVALGVLGSRSDLGRASDLAELFHRTGPGLDALSAELLVVERGFHPEVPERVYVGSMNYLAPETLAFELADTTSYPGDEWIPNDVRVTFDNGDFAVKATTGCPIPAMPGCLGEPVESGIIDQPPFVEGTLRPLELIGPGRSFILPNGTDVAGTPDLGGRSAVQVRSTVAAVELLEAITEHGSWRELHPTDPVVMWLDLETLVPVRIEVFAADTFERELWQVRRGYVDEPDGLEPIFILAMSDLDTDPVEEPAVLSVDSVSGGFLMSDVELPRLAVPDGFAEHRSGVRFLHDGGEVSVASWSDGRAWLKMETIESWDGSHLFGMTSQFVQPVDLGRNSVGYLAPQGDAISIHSNDIDIVIRGSIAKETLIEVAASLSTIGLPVPASWDEAAVIGLDDLPTGTLVPDVEGWSILARLDTGQTAILLTGAGQRGVLITQGPGRQQSLPVGSDVSAVDLRGTTGTFDAAVGVLEWVEDGARVRIASDTVTKETLLDIAKSMRQR